MHFSIKCKRFLCLRFNIILKPKGAEIVTFGTIMWFIVLRGVSLTKLKFQQSLNYKIKKMGVNYHCCPNSITFSMCCPSDKT